MQVSKPLKKGRGRKMKRTVVHLGNVGMHYERQKATKTRARAEDFPDVQFIGIDKAEHASTRGNWKQIKAKFGEGLRALKDASVHIISSEMALGYYREEATNTLLQLSWEN
jgi:hypothetical protein